MAFIIDNNKDATVLRQSDKIQQTTRQSQNDRNQKARGTRLHSSTVDDVDDWSRVMYQTNIILHINIIGINIVAIRMHRQ
jgi:hypothetical protein